MNKQRRNVLHKVLDGLAKLRDPVEKTTAIEILKTAVDKVGVVVDDEDMAQTNLPETLQFSALYDNLSDNINDLYDAQGELEAALEMCEENDFYDYSNIQKEIVDAVNAIKNAIHR